MNKLYKIVGCDPKHGTTVQNGVLTETMTGKNRIILFTIGHARRKAKAFDGTIEQVNQFKINPINYWSYDLQSSLTFQDRLGSLTDEVKKHLELLIKENEMIDAVPYNSVELWELIKTIKGIEETLES